MSKLEELILKLCPNGVEYKKFNDFAMYIRADSLVQLSGCTAVYYLRVIGFLEQLLCHQYMFDNEPTLTAACCG
jgi:hypothetical protein